MADADAIVDSIWARRLSWSQAADRLGAGIARARTIMLLLSCIGAILATGAATLPLPADVRTGLAALGAVCLGVSTYVATQWLTSANFRAWTMTRSVSETLKAEVFLCRARCGRYAGADRFKQLNKTAGAIEDGASEFEGQLAPALPGGAAPGELDENSYIALRVIEQAQNYFRPAASRYAARARSLRIVAVICGMTASALSGVVAILSTGPGEPTLDLAAWVAVLTTLGTAVAAHISGRRYDFLVLTYRTTARHLESLINEWRSVERPLDAAAWDSFVQRCEAVIAQANQSWITKLAQPESS